MLILDINNVIVTSKKAILDIYSQTFTFVDIKN